MVRALGFLDIPFLVSPRRILYDDGVSMKVRQRLLSGNERFRILRPDAKQTSMQIKANQIYIYILLLSPCPIFQSLLIDRGNTQTNVG